MAEFSCALICWGISLTPGRKTLSLGCQLHKVLFPGDCGRKAKEWLFLADPNLRRRVCGIRNHVRREDDEQFVHLFLFRVVGHDLIQAGDEPQAWDTAEGALIREGNLT